MRKDHKTERRKFTAQDLYCLEPSCRFYEKHAVQGVCFNNKWVHLSDWLRLEKREKELADEIHEITERYSLKRRCRYYEGMYLTAMLNSDITMDECLRLRRDNADLRLELERLKKRQRPRAPKGRP